MKKAIRFSDFSFGFQSRLLFEELDLALDTEKVTLLTGANGSGKTTLCRLIMGLQKNYHGKLMLHGKNIVENETCQLADKITYLKQNAAANLLAATPQLDLEVWNSKFINSINDVLIKDALSWFDLDDFAGQPVWELSGGQLQRLALSSLILNYDKFWLLDEPAAGLDKIQQQKLLILIREHRQFNGTLIISHRYQLFSRIADDVYEIKDKKIFKR